jgi:Fur family ferric uptake transcriptional regulator
VTPTPASPRRTTKQRSAVASQLDKEQTFRSAQDIYASMREKGSTIGLATIYRALQGMVEDGELDVLRTDDGESVYRRCSSGHHHHLVCRVCGRTIEVQDKPVERWAAKVAADHGFTDVEHQVEVFGTCAQCHVARDAG